MLAFHIALVENPQEAIVLRAFASLLYHRKWSKAVKFAREHEDSVLRYVPEVSKSSDKISDEDLAEAVSEFTDLIKHTIYALTEMEALREALDRYPDFECSGLVFIPKKKARDVANWFTVLSKVESYKSGKEGFSIDYISLGKGNPCETGFVLGKIILDTITEGTDIEQINLAEKKQSQIVPVVCMEKKDDLVISKPSNGQALVHGLKASSVFKAQQKILKLMSEDNEHKNEQEIEVCRDGQATNQDQSLIRKPKKRSSKDAPASEAPKPKRLRSDEQECMGSKEKNHDQSVIRKLKLRSSKETPASDAPTTMISKRSRSGEQECIRSLSGPAKNQSLDQKSNKHGTKKPVSETLKPKSSKRSRSDDQECMGSLNQDQSLVQKSNKHVSKAPVSEAPKPKKLRSDEQERVESLVVPDSTNNKRRTEEPPFEPRKQKPSKKHSKETQKPKRNDINEIQEAKHGFVSDQSMSDIVKVLEKSRQKVSSKEEIGSLSSEKKKRPRKLSSLFR